MTWGRSPSFSVVVIALIFFSGYNLGGNMCTPPPARPTSSNEAAPQDDVPPECPSVMRGPGVPTFKVRADLGAIVQSEGFVRGMELGVQRGHFSKQILASWPDCVEYHLVDLWAPQENYKDVANVNQREQDKIYNEAMESVAPWKEKIHVCRNYTTACVDNYDDVYFDFIYVDARHDFKGVWEESWLGMTMLPKKRSEVRIGPSTMTAQ